LRDSVGRDEADGVNVLEASGDQGLEIVGLQVGGDLAFEALPGIAGAFDELDGISSWHLALGT